MHFWGGVLIAVLERSISHFQDQVRAALGQVCQTPGVMMVKVEPLQRVGSALRTQPWVRTIGADDVPETIELPAETDRVRLTAFGAFEPTRPTDTPQTLLAELNHQRKMAGVESLPRGTAVKTLGHDDLGFLSYQICMEISAAADDESHYQPPPPHRPPLRALCEGLCEAIGGDGDLAVA